VPAPAEPASTWPPEVVANAVRVLIFALCLALVALDRQPVGQLVWFPVALAGGLVAGAYQRPNVVADLLRGFEAVVCAATVLITGGAGSALFPYLIASAFAGGVLAGAGSGLLAAACAAAVLFAAIPLMHTGSGFASQVTQWVLLAAAAGLLAAWVRRLQIASERDARPADRSYAEAYRLLTQLRPVARELSVGLDPATIAEGLLQALYELHEFDRGAVYVRGEADRSIPLALLGATRLGWDIDVTGDGPFAEAWRTRRPHQLNRQLSGAPGSSLILPLAIGQRTFGLAVYEAADRRLGFTDVDAAGQLAAETALRLDTALLFTEVRDLATVEERHRLAREIHDGIAQELSSLGYFVDGLVAEARTRDDGTAGALGELRGELTRIVGELRLSIFDLRSDIDGHGGFGAALSEYVRSIGRRCGITVHLSLSESTHRLPAETEAEMLRIAQEAITNVRKHADADNLWVSLVVEPPRCLLRIEDDGRGLGSPGADSVGLQVMRERAARLRTQVDVLSRLPRGTTVEVHIGDRDSEPLPTTDLALTGSLLSGRSAP
jgi:signal transduction histidine kinase